MAMGATTAFGLSPHSPPLLSDGGEDETRVGTFEALACENECVLGVGAPVFCIAFAPRHGSARAVLAAGVGSYDTSQRFQYAGRLASGCSLVQLWEIDTGAPCSSARFVGGVLHLGCATHALSWWPRAHARAGRIASAWLAYCTGCGLIALQAFASDGGGGELRAEGTRVGVPDMGSLDIVRGGDDAEVRSTYVRDALGDFGTSVSWCSASGGVGSSDGCDDANALLVVGTSHGSVVILSMRARVLEPVRVLDCSTAGRPVVFASFSAALDAPALQSGECNLLMVVTGKGVQAWDVLGSGRMLWSKGHATSGPEALCGAFCMMSNVPTFVAGMDHGDVELSSLCFSRSKYSPPKPNLCGICCLDVDPCGRRLVYAKSTGDVVVADVSGAALERKKARKGTLLRTDAGEHRVIGSCALSAKGTEPVMRLRRSGEAIPGTTHVRRHDGEAGGADDVHVHVDRGNEEEPRPGATPDLDSNDTLAAVHCVQWVPDVDSDVNAIAAGCAIGIIRVIPADALSPPIAAPAVRASAHRHSARKKAR